MQQKLAPSHPNDDPRRCCKCGMDMCFDRNSRCVCVCMCMCMCVCVCVCKGVDLGPSPLPLPESQAFTNLVRFSHSRENRYQRHDSYDGERERRKRERRKRKKKRLKKRRWALKEFVVSKWKSDVQIKHERKFSLCNNL